MQWDAQRTHGHKHQGLSRDKAETLNENTSNGTFWEY